MDRIRIPTEEEDPPDWREYEAQVDGGYCGCEFPRLWPPHRKEESRLSEYGVVWVDRNGEAHEQWFSTELECRDYARANVSTLDFYGFFERCDGKEWPL